MEIKLFVLCLTVFLLEAAPRSHLSRHLTRTLGDFADVQRSIATALSTLEDSGDGDKIDLVHHNYEMTKTMMEDIHKKCPDITKMYSIGKSVEGKELFAMAISQNPDKHTPGIPEFKYVACMHGNEVVGKELLLHLMKRFCDNHLSNQKDARLENLVKTVRMHFLPVMNPDGNELAYNNGGKDWLLGRTNAHNKDLNRNFPDQYVKNKDNEEPEPETKEVMEWIKSYPFVLSANLHGGSLVANYPFDDTENQKTEYSKSPDDDVFIKLAETYANNHREMWKKEPEWDCPEVPVDHFDHGITNGASWYNVAGGMQDFNYLHSDAMEITLELGCDKFPAAHKLQRYWDDNKNALLSFIEMTKTGVKGFVKDSKDQPISGAIIEVKKRDHVVHSHEDGDFWRILLPGRYEITAKKEGYVDQSQFVTVPKGGQAAEINFILKGAAFSNDGEQQTVSRTSESLDVESPLLKQIQNIDQQLMSNAAQPWQGDVQQYSPTVSIAGISAQGVQKPSEDEDHEFFMNSKDDDDDNNQIMMNDFQLEKQDFYDQKTDLETADQA